MTKKHIQKMDTNTIKYMHSNTHASSVCGRWIDKKDFIDVPTPTDEVCFWCVTDTIKEMEILGK